MTTIRALPILALFLSFPAFLGCRQQAKDRGGRIANEDGVIVVRNAKDPLYQEQILALREELAIGQSGGRDEYMFSRINGMDVDDSGNVYAIEGVDSCVRVFDKDGLFLRTIGRKGQGPGEFQMPLFVQITAAGEVFVGDYSGAQAAYFSRSGDYLRRKAMPRPFIPIRQDSLGNVLGLEISAPPPMGGKSINKYDAELRPVAVIASEEEGERTVFDIGKPSCFADMTSNDHIIWGDSKEYTLYEIDASGRLIRKIIKEATPRRIGPADKRRYEEEYAEPLKMGMTLRFREHYPAFSDISTDDEGRILVKTYERVGPDTGRYYFDVFGPDGIYVAKLDIKATLDRNSVWKNGKLYIVESSPEGFPLIKRYGVKWPR